MDAVLYHARNSYVLYKGGSDMLRTAVQGWGGWQVQQSQMAFGVLVSERVAAFVEIFSNCMCR